MNARSVLPELKSETTDPLSFVVLRATTPSAPLQVESTAAGRKCSRLVELSVWIWGAAEGQPASWAAKVNGMIAVLEGVTGGPLPTLLPVPASSGDLDRAGVGGVVTEEAGAGALAFGDVVRRQRRVSLPAWSKNTG